MRWQIRAHGCGGWVKAEPSRAITISGPCSKVLSRPTATSTAQQGTRRHHHEQDPERAALLRFCGRVIRRCSSLGLLVAVEAPRWSSTWTYRGVTGALHSAGARTFVYDSPSMVRKYLEIRCDKPPSHIRFKKMNLGIFPDHLKSKAFFGGC